MGGDHRCAWDDRKRQRNLAKHGLDFADLKDVFDGRYCLTREDQRQNYGEARYNMLVRYVGRIINITFTPRAGKIRLISARLANRAERSVFDAKRPQGRWRHRLGAPRCPER